MRFLTQDELYSARDVKVEAKAQLRGHWKEAIFLALIPTLFTAFFMTDLNQSGNVNGLSLVLQVIQSFLLTGVSFTLLDFIRHREPIEPLSGSIRSFQGKYFLQLLWLKILKNIYIFLWLLLLIIPGLVKAYSYSQAERIFKDKVDELGEVPNASACLRESQELMQGRKLDLFTLDLSFFGWYLLAFMSLGIGLLWLVPYVEMSQTVFYQNSLYEVGSMRRPVDGPFEEVGKDPDDFSDFEDF